MRIVSLLAIVLLISTRTFAQSPEAGTIAFPFLNLGYDARSVAMAGAATAMPNDLYGLISNPASVGFIDQTRMVMAGYRPVLMDVWGSPLAFAQKIDRYGVFAINVVTMSGGKLDVVGIGNDGDWVATGKSAIDNSLAGGVSWSNIIWKTLAVGVTVKGVYHYLNDGYTNYSADGFAVDAGVQYRLRRGRLIYGLSFQNIGFMRSGYIGDEKSPFPMKVEAGISYVPQYIPMLRVALDVNARRGDYINFEPGFEADIYKKVLQLRGGFSFSQKDLREKAKMFTGEVSENYVKSSLNTFTTGIGLNTEIDKIKLRIDMGLAFRSGLNSPGVVLSALAGF